MTYYTFLVISVIHDPKFIIFDEPTNGLDIIAARDVRDFILEMKAKGKCVIISTHLFDLAEKICDRAAIIVDGKIVKNDTLEIVSVISYLLYVPSVLIEFGRHCCYPSRLVCGEAVDKKGCFVVKYGYTLGASDEWA